MLHSRSVRYSYLRAAQFGGKLPLFAIGALCFIVGCYLSLLTYAPAFSTNISEDQLKHITQHAIENAENRVIIPSIGVNLPYLPGDEDVLNEAVWHRFPERGNPEQGGNFILSAHRFELGFSPGATRVKSPFYRVDKLQVGEKIIIVFDGKQFVYSIDEKKSVKPTDTYVEDYSEQPKLTLYTCTFGGSLDGRDIILASLAS